MKLNLARFRQNLEHEINTNPSPELIKALIKSAELVIEHGYWDEIFDPLFNVAKESGIKVAERLGD